MFETIKRLIADGALSEIYFVETDYQSYNGVWWGGWEDGRKKDTGYIPLISHCNLEDAVKTHEMEPENANFGVCSTV